MAHNHQNRQNVYQAHYLANSNGPNNVANGNQGQPAQQLPYQLQQQRIPGLRYQSHMGGGYPAHYQGQPSFDNRRPSAQGNYNQNILSTQPPYVLATAYNPYRNSGAKNYYSGGLGTPHRTQGESPPPYRPCSPSRSSTILVAGLGIVAIAVVVVFAVVLSRDSASPDDQPVGQPVLVTYDGSLRLTNKVFTDRLYDPHSTEFKGMENYTCGMVKDILADDQTTCMVKQFNNGSVNASFLATQELTTTDDTDPMDYAKSRQAEVQDRLTEALQNNPDVEDVTFNVKNAKAADTLSTSAVCAAEEFTCSQGGCVVGGEQCDGVNDCALITPGDNSDEDGCACELNEPCRNGGTCSLVNGDVQCACATGYTGDFCTDEVPCVNDNPCHNGGTCSRNGNSLTYTCQCPNGFEGTHCEDEVPCVNDNPCNNGGICNRNGNTATYTCQCANGFEGTHCDDEVPCVNNNPCNNDGICNRNGNTATYTCQCADGYEGTHCDDAIPCDRNNPCSNGGTCSGTMLDHQCSCPDGFEGTNCDDEIPCDRNNPCNNGGTCSGSMVNNHCECADGFEGTYCDEIVPVQPSSSAGTSPISTSSISGDVTTSSDNGAPVISSSSPVPTELPPVGSSSSSVELLPVSTWLPPDPSSSSSDIILPSSTEAVTMTPAVTTESAILDLCEVVDCGIGECKPVSPSTYYCLCPGGDTQEEPCKEQEEDCGGVLGGLTGEFTSPNYPENYPNDTVCIWTILGAPGKVITVTFLDFSIEYQRECIWDRLSAYEDGGTNGTNRTEIFKACGYDIPDDIATLAETLTLKFISDYVITDRGFQAEYHITDYEPPCNSVFCENGGTCVNEGVGPNDYYCECAPGWSGYNCLDFDGDSCEPNPCVHGNCTDGYFTYDCTCDIGYIGINCTEVDPCVDAVCHAEHSQSPLLEYCSFTDHIRVCECGDSFHAPCSNDTDGGEHAVSPGELTFVGSKYWPNLYPNNEDRRWVFYAGPGNIVNVTLLYLMLEGCWDKLYIYEGEGVYGPQLARLCNSDADPPESYLSSTDTVTLRFTSDGSVRNNGFLAVAEAVKGCGEQLNATLTSQQYTITLSSNTSVCSYVITSSPGSRIEVTITDGTNDTDMCSSIEVTFDPNPETGGAQHYYPFCGDGPGTYTSTSNQVIVEVPWFGAGTFTLDMTYVELTDPDDCADNPCAAGSTCVDLVFDFLCECPENTVGRYCDIANCGGVLEATTTPQSLVLPEFPEYDYYYGNEYNYNYDYNEGFECVWNISASNESRGLVFDIDDHTEPGQIGDGCEWLHVEISTDRRYGNRFYVPAFCGRYYSRPYVEPSSQTQLIIYTQRRPRSNNYTLEILYHEIEDGDGCADNQCAAGSTCVDLPFDYSCTCPENTEGRYCEVANCGGVFEATTTPQTLVLPEFPEYDYDDYNDDYRYADAQLECVWNISASNELSRLSIDIDDHTEPWESSETCGYLSFTISTGAGLNWRMSPFCGDDYPRPYVFTSSEIQIVVQSFGVPRNYTGTIDLVYQEIEDRDDCDPNNCEHGGTCIDGSFSYNCTCPDNYLGRHCEYFDSDSCDPDPCVHGTCFDGQLDYRCECDPGYGGKNCSDTDPCADALCQTYGFCLYDDRAAPCICFDEWTGQNCTNSQYVTTSSSTITLASDDVKLISSPNWPENYPNSADETFTIHSPDGRSVKLVVLDLNIESSCSYDTITIYDGDNTFSPELMELCYSSDQPDGAVYSSGSSMTFRFRSDSIIAYRGFLISVEPVEGCGEQLNATLTSQQYSITSSSDTSLCSYVIMSSPGSGIEVTITDGGANDPDMCSSIEVTFDPNTERDELGYHYPFCGNRSAIFNSTNNHVALRVEWFGPGTFTLDVTYVELEDPDDCADNPCEVGSTCVDLVFDFSCTCPENTVGRYCEVANCGGAIEATTTPQSLVLPEFPEYVYNYEDYDYDYDSNNDLHCVWNISASNEFSRLSIDIDDHTEPGQYGENCGFLYVEVSSDLMNKYDLFVSAFCGGGYPRPFEFNSSKIQLVVFTEGRPRSNNYTIDILYQEIEDRDDCDPNNCVNGGTCIDGSFSYNCICPENYLGPHCEYFDGNSCDPDPCVHGTCFDFQLDYTCECDPGYGGKNCSSADPCADALCQTYGFCLYDDRAAPCICFDEWTGQSCANSQYVTTLTSTITLASDDVKLISSPNWPGNYPNNAYETFIIHSPVGSSVKLVVLDLNIESSCSYDTITIYDGDNTFSPELMELCYSSDQPDEAVYSSGSSMTFRFQSDSIIAYRGFLISVEAVKGCGEQLNATLTSQQYTITSSSNRSLCSYVITSSPGSGVEITITDGTNDTYACSSIEVTFDPNPETEVLQRHYPFCGNGPVTFNSTRNQVTVTVEWFGFGTFTLDMTYVKIEDPDDCADSLCAAGSTCVDLVFDFSCTCPENTVGRYCEVANCGGVLEATTTPQSLVFPEFPEYDYNYEDYDYNYDPDKDVQCVWNISASNELSRLSIDIDDHTEPGQYGEACGFIYFVVSSDLVNTEIWPFCGDDYPRPYVITSSEAQLVFAKFLPSSNNYTIDIVYQEIEDRDDCDPNNCLNSGTCIDGSFSYNCICPENYLGHNCEYFDGDSCDPDPCVHGTCTDGQLDYTCECHSGYGGKNCSSTDPCADALCQTYNYCLYDDRAAPCVCTNEWTGDSCANSQYVTTSSSTIMLASDDVKLISSPYWPGDYPNYADETFTIHSPDGSSVKLVVLDLYLECCCSYDTITIYDGDNTFSPELMELCTTSDKPAGAVYSSDNSMTFRFQTDGSVRYRGFLISVEPAVGGEACNDNPCENGGTCVEQGLFDYSCGCPNGFGGTTCHLPGCGGTLTSQTTPQVVSVPEVTDTVSGCIWIFDSPPDSRVNLVVEELEYEYCYKIHLTIWSGDMDTGILLFSGSACSVVTNVTIQSLTNRTTIRYRAEQDDEANKLVASYLHVFDVDDCAMIPCGGGATCHDGHFTFTCVCPNGTQGDICQYVDHCYLNNPCENDGECSSPIGAEQAECNCKPGYSGDVCQYLSGCDIDLNVTDTKQYVTTEGYPEYYENNQDCSFNFEAPPGAIILVFFEHVDLESGYDYIVMPDGTRYDRDPPSPVRSDSSSFTIRFTSDISNSGSGILMSYIIDIDDCEASPCQNGGTCIDGYEGYECECTEQWYGQNCTEYNNCHPDPCVNGTCTDGDDAYTCSCFDKYMGQNCADKNPACGNVTCENGGRCLYANDTHPAVCVCPNDFTTGEFCEVTLCGNPHFDPDTIRNPNARIVGGKEVELNSWPWQISLQNYGGRHNCGGSIVRENFVITAVHCTPSVGDRMFLGAHDVSLSCEEDGCIEVTITDVWLHEDYSRNPTSNDIAVVKFTPSVEFNRKISPVCQPEAGDVIPEGTYCYATGWGTGNEDNKLYQVHLEMITQDDCAEAYSNFDRDTMICAGDLENGGRGPCYGDSGGPLVCRSPGQENWKLFGISSWAYRCTEAPAGKPVVFVRVINYLDWINDILDKDE